MVKAIARSLFVALVIVSPVVVSPAAAQSAAPASQQPPATMSLSGPRVGMTILGPDVVGRLRNDFDGNIRIGQVISQFGWQKEKRFYANPDGLTGVSEFVFLIGGVEQGLFIPSLNWLTGVRTSKGVEFAVGPNLSPFGAGIAAATGVTFRKGDLNFPINFAAVRSQGGVRVSVLAGFNARR
jgi:hypothetical protein